MMYSLSQACGGALRRGFATSLLILSPVAIGAQPLHPHAESDSQPDLQRTRLFGSIQTGLAYGDPSHKQIFRRAELNARFALRRGTSLDVLLEPSALLSEEFRNHPEDLSTFRTLGLLFPEASIRLDVRDVQLIVGRVRSPFSFEGSIASHERQMLEPVAFVPEIEDQFGVPGSHGVGIAVSQRIGRSEYHAAVMPFQNWSDIGSSRERHQAASARLEVSASSSWDIGISAAHSLTLAPESGRFAALAFDVRRKLEHGLIMSEIAWRADSVAYVNAYVAMNYSLSREYDLIARTGLLSSQHEVGRALMETIPTVGVARALVGDHSRLEITANSRVDHHISRRRLDIAAHIRFSW